MSYYAKDTILTLVNKSLSLATLGKYFILSEFFISIWKPPKTDKAAKLQDK